MCLTSSRSCTRQGELAAQSAVLRCAVLCCAVLHCNYGPQVLPHILPHLDLQGSHTMIVCQVHKLSSQAPHCLNWLFCLQLLDGRLYLINAFTVLGEAFLSFVSPGVLQSDMSVCLPCRYVGP